MQTTWYAARLICLMRAACVVGGGGGKSHDLFLVALEISYIMTTTSPEYFDRLCQVLVGID
jgi:hypothetical protein